jgi:hypothetical protein
MNNEENEQTEQTEQNGDNEQPSFLNDFPSVQYGITLLDDIHNYFPDLLYNQQRFNNVRDVLTYLRHGAQDTERYRDAQRRYDQSRRRRERENHQNIRRIRRRLDSRSHSPVSLRLDTPDYIHNMRINYDEIFQHPQMYIAGLYVQGNSLNLNIGENNEENTRENNEENTRENNENNNEENTGENNENNNHTNNYINLDYDTSESSNSTEQTEVNENREDESNSSEDDDIIFYQNISIDDILPIPRNNAINRGDRNNERINNIRSFIDRIINTNNLEPVIVSLPESDLNTYTTRFHIVSEDEVYNPCSICQEDIRLGEEIRSICHCNHSFHINCIDTWFQRSVRCPNCRFDVRDTPRPNIEHYDIFSENEDNDSL